jgi:MHS family proline/betaine transporter-like MFS transporter
MKANRKVIISGMLGNGLEWYDYAIYAHMAHIFAKVMFPASDDNSGLVLAYLAFAAGFISRPLGAIFFGRLGDKFGRKKALVASMLMMAVPTGCIGLLPTYASIGVAAPIILLLLRIIQGLALGGAYSGSISYVVEHAPPTKRSIVGSVIKISLVIGFLSGSLVSTLISSVMSEEAFTSWGWRIPFILGVAIGFVGYYIRHHGEESPVYEQAKKDGTLSQRPLRDAFSKHSWLMLQGFMIYLTVTIPFYMVAVYMISYSQDILGLSSSQSLLINSVAMASMLITIWPSALLADRIGRRPVLMMGIIAMALVIYPALTQMQPGSFLVTNLGTFGALLVAQVAIAMTLGWYLAPIPATLVELYPTSIRYTGMSLAYNICAIVGGFTPSAAVWLISRTQDNVSIMYLMLAANALSFLAIFVYKDRWRDPLPA